MAGTEDLAGLYDASYRRLVVQLFAICGDQAEAEDAVQAAFVTAIRKRRELSRVANQEAWVRVVAVNRLRSGWRHSAVVRKYQSAVPGPQAPVEVGPEHVAIMTALAGLSRSSVTSWSCTTWPISGPPRSPPSWGSPRAP